MQQLPEKGHLSADLNGSSRLDKQPAKSSKPLPLFCEARDHAVRDAVLQPLPGTPVPKEQLGFTNRMWGVSWTMTIIHQQTSNRAFKIFQIFQHPLLNSTSAIQCEECRKGTAMQAAIPASTRASKRLRFSRDRCKFSVNFSILGAASVAPCNCGW